MKTLLFSFVLLFKIALCAALSVAQTETLDAAGDVQQKQSAPHAPTLDLTISLKELSWEKLLELLPPALADRLDDYGLSGLGSVTIQPKGTLGNLAISGEFDLSDSGIHYLNMFVKPDTERAGVIFDLVVKRDSLELNSLSVALGDLVLKVSGSLSNFENPVLDLQLNSNEFSLPNLLSFFPDIQAAISESTPESLQTGGGGTLQVAAKGPIDDLDLDLNIDLDQSEIRYQNLFRKSAQSSASITVQAHLGQNAVSVKHLSLSLGDFQVTAQGTIGDVHAPDLDVVLETNLFDIEALLSHFPIVTAHYLPPELTLSGAGKLSAASKGKLGDMTVSGAIDVTQAAIVFGEYFTKAKEVPGRLDLDLRLTKDAVDIRQMQLNLNDLLLDLQGVISGLPQDALLDLALTAPPIDLQQLLEIGFPDAGAMPKLAGRYQGQIDLALRLEGRLTEPSGSAHISLNQLQYQGKTVPEITFKASLYQQQLHASLTAFQDMLSASFDLGLDSELPYQVEVLLEKAEVERFLVLASEMKGISGLLSGTISSEGSLHDLSQVSGEISMTELSLNLFGQTFRNRQPIELSVTPEGLIVTSLELEGDRLQLFSQGLVEFDGESRLELDGMLDLRFLQSFLPDTLGISELDGRLSLFCTLKGPLQAPRLAGLAELHHGHVRSLAYPDPITDINGKLLLSEGKLILPGLTGDTSRGELLLRGELAYSNGTPDRFSLELQGERLKIKRLVEALEMTVSPSLTLVGNFDRQVLSGEIVIHDALYNRDLDAVINAAQEEKARNISLVTDESFEPEEKTISERRRGLVLNLAIATDNDIQVRNRQALLDLRADLHVRGSPAQPQITGLVEIVKGSFYLFNIRYHVLNARLDFFDPQRINPAFNILLETLHHQYNITVSLDGDLERMSLNVSSDPFLSENEILALLLKGAKKHLQLVQGPIISWMEKASREIFALDQVTLDTTPLVLNGRMTDSPSLTLVKRLFDKLLLTYVTSVGGADRFQIFQGEYEFSEKLSAAIRGDEKGDFDTGVMYQFRLK